MTDIDFFANMLGEMIEKYINVIDLDALQDPVEVEEEKYDLPQAYMQLAKYKRIYGCKVKEKEIILVDKSFSFSL